jgi:hypothetical protein
VRNDTYRDPQANVIATEAVITDIAYKCELSIDGLGDEQRIENVEPWSGNIL